MLFKNKAPNFIVLTVEVVSGVHGNVNLFTAQALVVNQWLLTVYYKPLIIKVHMRHVYFVYYRTPSALFMLHHQ